MAVKYQQLGFDLISERKPRRKIEFTPIEDLGSDKNLVQSAMELYRPPEHIDFEKAAFTSRPVNYETAAKIAELYHYAHTVPSITLAIGAYTIVDGAELLAGVICYGISANRNTTTVCGEAHKDHVLELNRLFCFDWAGRNIESWLVGQSFKWLAKMYPEYYIIVSYSDLGQNHYGYIYQATNFLYTGLSEAMSTAGFIIEGKKLHNRSVFTRYGTCGVEGVKAAAPDAIPYAGTPKHRYVMFLGSKHQKKELIKALQWEVKPYPKKVAE